MKKILLIKPDYNYFSIGLAYIVGALERKKIPYDFIDMYLNPEQDFNAILKKGKYLAVASGGLIGSFTFFKRLFIKIKTIDPAMPCILGGNITTAVNTHVLLSSIPVDFFIIGEGEITFPELIFCLAKDRARIGDIRGVVYRAPVEKKGYLKTGRRKQLDLTETNWMPDWSFFDINSYGFQTMPVLTGRGCTGRCSFCSPTNGGFRSRPVEHIIEEIKMLYSDFDFVHLVFMNEIFFPDEETITSFCREYRKLKPQRHWHCLMRMDIDPVVLQTMRDAGCILMNVGVESGSNTVLENIKKDLTTDDMRCFITAAKGADVVTQASFMMANYGETEDDICKTIDLMLDLEISGPMALTINYPGTLNYHRARRQKRISDEKAYIESLDSLYSKNYYQVISGHLSGTLHYLNLSAMSDRKLFKVVEREMRRFYTEGFRIRNVELEISPVKEKITGLKGNCPFCRHGVEFKMNDGHLHPFGLRVNCAKCGERDLYFDPFEVPAYKEYYNTAIAQELQSSKRYVVISGVEEARIFLMLDLLGFDYSLIQGFIAHQAMPKGYALNHPIIPFEKIDELQPDLFMVINGMPFDIQQKMNAARQKRNTNKILWLSPEQAFKDVIPLNRIFGKNNLIISSGPIDLLKLILDSLRKIDPLIKSDLLIQKSRFAQLDTRYQCPAYFIPETTITLAHFDSELLEGLRNNAYESVIFLANNNELLGYHEIRNLSGKLNPREILAFPIGNVERPLDEMHLFVL